MGRQWPLPQGSFQISSRFEGRVNPVTGAAEHHSGTDFAADDGTPFYACAGGTVLYIGPASGYGQWIVLDHPDSEGGGVTEYGHMWDAYATGLQQGQWVDAGQLIGYVGSNGQATGPHLHLTVWERAYGGQRIDPETWLSGAPYPPSGGGQAPASTPTTGGSMTIFGVDVSEHQDGMSLAQAKREGMEFAFIRTTDGTYQDRCYRSHLDDAEGAGMVTAAYHFCRRPDEGTSVAQQVEASLAVMGDARRPVWLDVETPGGFSGDLVAQFKAEFERRGVRVAGVYSYVPYWEGQMGLEPDSHAFGPFWVAGYPPTQGGAPASIYTAVGGDGAGQWAYPLGNQAPSIWQFTDRATVAGHQVDANAFRGSADALRTLINGGEAANSEEEITVAEADRIIKHVEDFIAGFCGPIGSDTKDIREQLTGGRDAGQYPGWDIKTVLNAARRKNFRALTSMEIQAVLLAGTKDDIKAARAAAQEQ
jgi:GH25 family lysozyme M1 (1,4-beta-N-acetylmuramidase)